MSTKELVILNKVLIMLKAQSEESGEQSSAVMTGLKATGETKEPWLRPHTQYSEVSAAGQASAVNLHSQEEAEKGERTDGLEEYSNSFLTTSTFARREHQQPLKSIK